MDSSIERTAPEDLLVHLGALQALARELVRSDQAEDLAQQTILRALENPPRREGNLRGWLAQGQYGTRFTFTRLQTSIAPSAGPASA